MIRLRLERIDRGLTQKQLAQMASVPQPVVSLIEVGRWNPTPEELEALGAALGVSPASLLLKPVVVEPSHTDAAEPTEK